MTGIIQVVESTNKSLFKIRVINLNFIIRIYDFMSLLHKKVYSLLVINFIR